MKILIMNTYNTYNYGSMMMAENLISYFIHNGIKADFFIENSSDDNIERLRKATAYQNIYKDKLISIKEINAKNKIIKIKNKLIEQIKTSKVKYYDAAIILGGDTFSEIYSKNIGVYLQLKKIQKINKNCKLFMIGQTIGPYTNWRAKMATKTFSKVKLFSRDRVSSKYLKEELNIDSIPMRDLAFLDLNLQTKYEKEYKKILAKYNLKDGNYITVVGTGLARLYSNNEQEFTDKFVEIIKKIKEKYQSKKIVWLSHVVTPNEPSDNTFLEEINNKYDNFINKNLMVIKETLLPVEARIILGHGYFTLTCRMHAAVSTFQMSRPAICLSYSPKYKGVIADGLKMDELVVECNEKYIHQENFVKEVLDKTNYIDENYDELVKNISTQVSKCQKIIKENLDEIIKEIKE